MQQFIPGDFVLFKQSIPYLGKLTTKWRRSFIIDKFGKNYSVLYLFKILDGKAALNIYHDNHLHIFYSQKRYLRPANEKPLKVMQNLHFKGKKD